jgi:hypothetical protein
LFIIYHYIHFNIILDIGYCSLHKITYILILYWTLDTALYMITYDILILYWTLDIIHYIQLHMTLTVLWDLVVILKDFTLLVLIMIDGDIWDRSVDLLKKSISLPITNRGRKDGQSAQLEPTFLPNKRNNTVVYTLQYRMRSVHVFRTSAWQYLATVRSPHGKAMPLNLRDRNLYIYSTNSNIQQIYIFIQQIHIFNKFIYLFNKFTYLFNKFIYSTNLYISSTNSYIQQIYLLNFLRRSTPSPFFLSLHKMPCNS